MRLRCFNEFVSVFLKTRHEVHPVKTSPLLRCARKFLRSVRAYIPLCLWVWTEGKADAFHTSDS